MKNILCKVVLGATLAGVLASSSLAAEQDGIAAMLDQKKIKYEVDKDKDYKIIYDFEEDKRTQIVYVSGTAEDFRGMKIRTVFAPAARLKDGLTGRFQSLLEQNGKSKIGAWEINGEMLFFSTRLIEPISPDQLSAMLNLVASIADDKEIEISGDRDEL